MTLPLHHAANWMVWTVCRQMPISWWRKRHCTVKRQHATWSSVVIWCAAIRIESTRSSTMTWCATWPGMQPMSTGSSTSHCLPRLCSGSPTTPVVGATARQSQHAGRTDWPFARTSRSWRPATNCSDLCDSRRTSSEARRFDIGRLMITSGAAQCVQHCA